MFKCRFFAIIFFSAIAWKYSFANKPIPFAKLATCEEYVIDNHYCKHFFPIDIFKNLARPEEDEILRLRFYVMSFHDANIVVNSEKSLSQRTEFVVGGWDNKRSALRVRENQEIDVSNLEGIVSPLFPTPIEISQSRNGTVEVSIPGVIEPLLRAELPELKMNFVCLQGFQETNRWFYNCREEQKSPSKPIGQAASSSVEADKVQANKNPTSETTTIKQPEVTTTVTPKPSFSDAEAEVLGDFTASAIKNLRKEEYKRLLQRKIQVLILESQKLDEIASKAT